MENTNKADLERIISFAKEIGVTDCDAILSAGESISMSAQNKELDSYKISGSRVIGIRVINDSRVGLSYTEAFDDESLKMTVKNALDNSKYAPLDENEKICNENVTIIAPFDNIVDVAIEKKIDLALSLESKMLAKDSHVAAVPYNGFSQGSSITHYLNSKNVYCEQRVNTISCYSSALIKKDDKNSMYYHGTTAKSFEDLNVEECIEQSFEHAMNWIDAKPIKTGKYDVIFTVNELQSLVGSFLGIFSAKAVKEKANPMAEKIGSKIADSRITIIDSPAYEKAYFKSYFDSEGFEQKDITLVNSGIMQDLLHNSSTARFFKCDNTYRASRGARSPLGVSSTNIRILCGKDSVETVCSGKYLEIHQMQGLHSGLNFMSGNFSFAASGYLYENGKRIQAVNGITVAGNFYKLIEEISAVSNTEEISTGASFFAPKIKFSNLTIAGE